MQRLRKGFTLIELLIAILLLMIVMLMIARMFTSAQNIYRTAAKRASVYSQGRIALDVIETDLSRIDNNTGIANLIISSQYADGSFTKDGYTQHFIDLPFSALPDPQSTQQIKPVLAFQTQTSWQLPNGEFQNGKAQVIYYLRKRPQRKSITGEFEEASTAYLMRRVVPLGSDLDYGALMRTDGDLQTGGQGFTQLPLEEEVASSVFEVRVWAYNNGAAAYMSQQSETLDDLYGFLAYTPDGITKLLEDKSAGPAGNNPNAPNAGNQPANQVVQLLEPQGGVTFTFGGWAGGRAILDQNGNAEYTEPRGNYPLAIGIELVIADDDASVDDGSYTATVRSIRRIISMPGAQPTVSMPPGQNGIAAYEENRGN